MKIERKTRVGENATVSTNMITSSSIIRKTEWKCYHFAVQILQRLSICCFIIYAHLKIVPADVISLNTFLLSKRNIRIGWLKYPIINALVNNIPRLLTWIDHSTVTTRSINKYISAFWYHLQWINIVGRYHHHRYGLLVREGARRKRLRFNPCPP